MIFGCNNRIANTVKQSFFAALLLLAFKSFAGNITKRIDFSTDPVVSQVNGYSKITLVKTTPFISSGKPVIPHVRLNVELPDEAEDVKISASILVEKSFPLPSPPEFAQPPATTDSSVIRSDGHPDKAIYSTNAFFPVSTTELKGIFTKNNRKIAAIRVFPVRVNPVASVMTFAASIRLDISYTESHTSVRKYLPIRTSSSDNSCTYLIITSNALAPSFTPLLAEKRATGISAALLTTDEIYENCQGTDAPEKIRACITDNYNNHGTKYVLLGGDASVVPTRMIPAKVTQDSETTCADIPCDLYYACLDGSWDSDHDGIFGETTDGENGGEIDLAAEVYVGRIPVSTSAEIEYFLTKNSAAPSRSMPESALFIGEYLGQYGNTLAYGGRALDEIERLFAGFDINWLDDRPKKPASPPSWTQQMAIDTLNAAPNVVVHSGHGVASKTMGLTASSVHMLTNPQPFLIASSACHIGSFDKTEECFAKAMLTSRHAAFAAQMNTRQGWFIAGYEHAYSCEFADAFLYSALLERMPLGEAHFKSKEEFLSSVESNDDSAPVYRWCYLENTLFGDPLAKLSLPDPMAVTQISFTNEVCISQSDLTAEFKFKITNTSPEPLVFSLTSDSLIFSGQSFYPDIPAISSTNIVVKVNAGDMKHLATGVFTDTICFSNHMTSATKSFRISLSVIPPLEITDSVIPADDLLVDFGTVTSGTSKTEFITLLNTSNVPFSVQSIYSDNRELANAPHPADFIAFDRTSCCFCTFGTDSSEINYLPISTTIDAIDTDSKNNKVAYVLSTESSSFAKLDLQTLALSKICAATPAIPTHYWSSLAFNEKSGKFFATSVETEYFDINTTFYIFPTNGTPPQTLATIEGNFNSLAIDKNGVIFSINIEDDTLYTVNPFTGETTPVGYTGIDANYSQALDFDASGTTLFWSANTEYDASIRILDTSTADNYALFFMQPEYGKLFPPELELALLPENTPFSISGFNTPHTVSPSSSSNAYISFSPVSAGEFTTRFSFCLPGASSPFATVTCLGLAIPPKLPSVSIISAHQRWPWNGKVDIVLTASDLVIERKYGLNIELLDIDNTTTNSYIYTTDVELTGISATNDVLTLIDAKAPDVFGKTPPAKIFKKAKLVPILWEQDKNR